MEKRKPLGNKLTKNPELEKTVIKWIEEDKDISDYEISKRLKDRYNFKITSPTISSWKKNYFNNAKKKFEVKLTEKDKEIFKTVDFKYNCLNSLTVDLKKIEKRISVLDTVLKSKQKTDKDGNKIPYIDSYLESMYKEYTKLVVEIKEKLIKYSDNQSPFDIVSAIINQTLEEILTIMKMSNVKEDGMNRLKNYFRDLYNEYKVKYDIKIKRGGI